MQVLITGRHMEMTEALQDYVKNKVERVSKYLENIKEANVTLSVEKYRHSAEVTIKANGITINGEEETDDMYCSIDRVMDKIERQVKKYKEKIRQHKPRQQLKEKNMMMNVFTAENKTEEAPSNLRIIKTKKLGIQYMSLDEAIMQMDLSGEDCFIFNNIASDSLSVIYRRKDDKLVLVEPEFQ
ncbi:MAG: ribosome-associated translation inhibitor RaiA [Thermoplasmata archaeon]|nr:MAG: ribosome-associated translation inhibitor RaiA [Thermoplasmata archaeon]